MGLVTALMFVLTIGPVERFRRSKQEVSYLGLNPRESSSGGRQRLGAIRKQGNSMARYLVVEAAQTAARYDEELRRDYQLHLGPNFGRLNAQNPVRRHFDERNSDYRRLCHPVAA